MPRSKSSNPERRKPNDAPPTLRCPLTPLIPRSLACLIKSFSRSSSPPLIRNVTFMRLRTPLSAVPA